MDYVEILDGEVWEDLTDDFETISVLDGEIKTDDSHPIDEVSVDNIISVNEAGDTQVEEQDDSPNESNKAANENVSFEVIIETPIETKPNVEVTSDTIQSEPSTYSDRSLRVKQASLEGLCRRIRRNTNYAMQFSKVRGRRSNNIILTEIVNFNTKKCKSHRKGSKPRSTALVFGVFATNVLCFILGFSFGWWNREPVPMYAVYEINLEYPTM